MRRVTKCAAIIRIIAVFSASLALSACVTVGGSSGNSGYSAGSNNNGSAAQPVNYAPSRAGMLEVEPLNFDPNNAPKACVNDLQIYRAHLQMPGASTLDLNKPINNYIREAGGPREALQTVYAQINDLNGEMDLELARRDPFNEQSRRRADDSIATLEDRILLNQALAEALECRQ